MKTIAVAVALSLFLASCSSEGEPASPPEVVPDAALEEDVVTTSLTYYGEIRPILDAHCTTCHRPDGPGLFDLSTFEAWTLMADAAVDAMDSGRMPPWLPDPTCREFVDQRVMPQAAKDEVRAWVDGGMPAGEVGADHQPPVPNDSFEATHSDAVDVPYLPDPSSPDDYRCFPLEGFSFESDMYLMASRVVPDQRDLVHHVLVYALPASSRQEALDAAAATPDPGYTCFGTPFPNSGGLHMDDASGLPTLVGGWVPGAKVELPDPEVSTRIAAGSLIVMQVHYNLLAGGPVGDATTFEMILQEEPTPFLAQARPLLLPDLYAAAHDPAAVNEHLFVNYTDEPIHITRVAAHMHLLGSSFHSEVVRANGETECVLDIPHWDFDWQQGYTPRDGEDIVLQPGDGITLRCVYDNSAENQPVIHGELAEPKDVHWGESSLDEMCMIYLTTIEPFEPTDPLADTCDAAPECLANCPEDGTRLDCLMSCDVGLGCVACALEGIVGCGGACVLDLLNLSQCPAMDLCFVNRMTLGSDLGACLASECAGSYESLTSCMEPGLMTGACDDTWAGCGISP